MTNIATSQGPNQRAGFTMIEMVVSLTIFGFAMTALVVGLQISAKGFGNIIAEQEQVQQTEHALQVMTDDLRHATVLPEDDAVFVESGDRSVGERLAFKRLASPKAIRPEWRYVYAEISYYLSPSEDNSGADLVRRINPFIGGRAVPGGAREEVLLTNIRNLAFSYVSSDGPNEVWNATNTLPSAVLITISPAESSTIKKAVAIPQGAFT